MLWLMLSLITFQLNLRNFEKNVIFPETMTTQVYVIFLSYVLMYYAFAIFFLPL